MTFILESKQQFYSACFVWNFFSTNVKVYRVKNFSVLWRKLLFQCWILFQFYLGLKFPIWNSWTNQSGLCCNIPFSNKDGWNALLDKIVSKLYHLPASNCSLSESNKQTKGCNGLETCLRGSLSGYIYNVYLINFYHFFPNYSLKMILTNSFQVIDRQTTPFWSSKFLYRRPGKRSFILENGVSLVDPKYNKHFSRWSNRTTHCCSRPWIDKT